MDRKKYCRTVALMSLLSESKTIDNADIAAFEGNGDFLSSLVVAVEPVQDLHGYDNICPISGWTGANIHVSPTTVAADGNTYPIAFPSEAGAVYGGTLNVTNGKLYVNRVLHSFTGDEKFSLLVASSIYARRFGVKLSSISGLPSVLTNDVICSHGVQKISTDANLYDFVAANDYISFYDYDGVYSTVSEFKANLAERYNSGNPVQACFFLKDPIVYDVDPIAIKTLVGQNNIWADTGKVIFLEYES